MTHAKRRRSLAAILMCGSSLTSVGFQPAAAAGNMLTNTPFTASNGYNVGFTTDFSSDGSTIVGSATPTGGFNTVPASMTVGGGIVSLGHLPGSTNSGGQAYGVNADASVIVGQAPDAQGNNQAFRWTADVGLAGLGFLNTTGTRLSAARQRSATMERRWRAIRPTRKTTIRDLSGPLRPEWWASAI